MATKKRSATSIDDLVARLDVIRPQQEVKTKAQTKADAKADEIYSRWFRLFIRGFSFSDPLSPEEKTELAALERKLPPPDPDDPLNDFYEALGKGDTRWGNRESQQ